jgi:hypothetical protein
MIIGFCRNETAAAAMILTTRGRAAARGPGQGRPGLPLSRSCGAPGEEGATRCFLKKAYTIKSQSTQTTEAVPAPTAARSVV